MNCIPPGDGPFARIARTVLYMRENHGLQLDMELRRLMAPWNRDDPPCNQEVERNDQIEAMQGNRNPFIDDPARADKLLR